MARTDRGTRKFAPLPPGIVKVRMEGESAPGLLALLTRLPGVAVVTGPDAYPDGRLYLTVAVLDSDPADAGGKQAAIETGEDEGS